MKKIGFIGQGWIGKNYADNFEYRGYHIVRYALEEQYRHNQQAIAKCDIVFIAVPTPTTPDGFVDEILREAIKNVGKGKIAVIKSTIFPGTTELLQRENPDIFVIHSPEFLIETNAAYDAANPARNIIGVPTMDDGYRDKAKEVLDVLPHAPYELICQAKEAELIKYGGNNWLFLKVVFANMLYDVSQKLGADWQTIRDGMSADERIGRTHLDPIHKSGRGAGGHCFIKDFAAFEIFYNKLVGDNEGIALLRSLREKNNRLLLDTQKDIDLLEGVYGKDLYGKRKKIEKEKNIY
jgi:UDPglucose 6-dehydrogenase